MGDRGAPGLIFLRPATQISNQLVHHSRSANTSGVVTLVLFHICGHDTLTHTFTHRLANDRRNVRSHGARRSHNLLLMNVYQHAQTHTEPARPPYTQCHHTHVPAGVLRSRSRSLIISFLFPVAVARPAAPLQPLPPSSLFPPSPPFLPPGI